MTLAEVARLLACEHIAPTWLLCGEFTGVWAERVELDRGVTTLTVDRRLPLTRCLAYCGEFQDVLPLRVWDHLSAWPTCTHSALSNRHLLRDKAADQRMFWGLAGVLYCMFAGRAHSRMVEQPETTLTRYFPWPHRVQTRTSHYGDATAKTICLYLVGASVDGLASFKRTANSPALARLPHWSFDTWEERDRHRSSWAHYPLFLIALAACLVAEPAEAPPPSYDDAVEALAVALYRAGLGVPEDYFAEGGVSLDPEVRAYQLEHGAGDGRRPRSVVPRSLAAPEPAAAAVALALRPPDVHPIHLAALAAAQLVSIATLTARGFMLFFMTAFAQPLVFAHVEGLTVLGAELPPPLSPKVTSMHVIERWAALAWGAAAPASTFMIGRYLDGPRIGVAVLPYTPPSRDVVRTVRERRGVAAHGPRMVWMTVAALAGLAIADPAARA